MSNSRNHFFLQICILFANILISFCLEDVTPMSNEEKAELREEARDMFYHAYRAYMENAYPADELMPLSCQGRYRGLTPNRGDIDDSLGNFSLTLIDTLDTLVILGDLEEFEHAVGLVIKDVSFNNDVVVSVFETNIRVLGGLLSGHILAEYLKQRAGIMQWYNAELLDMAKDVGYRLLPAFNTTTGIPYARVNLKYGIKSDNSEAAKETCTACAGSVILEMAALSRLTGEPIFEQKAHRAMDELWKMRHRSSDLMGSVLNVHSGDWVRRDSGVGAGIDSYYEYCLKAYILLGDNKYLNRFNRHYNAVMKYISQGPMLLDVHMHRPHTNSRNFMDALLAFWPGLQVLKGDIKPAVETHEMLYQVMKRHKFIPEAFTTDFQVHWGNHPLRPEFLESTYFLYGATNDPHYLEVGKNVLKSLQKYARVPCGYAAVNDVRTGKKEDRMDSFVLAETFKYLYLLFSDADDLILNMDEFIFTTEAHLLPLSLSHFGNITAKSEDLDDYENARTCPNTLQLFPGSVRKTLWNMVDGMCPKKVGKKRLMAAEFSASNLNHLKIIKDMGINIIALSDGRVQLLHTFSAARSISDAEDGLLFMQEMVELSKLQSQQPEAAPQAVSFQTKNADGTGNFIVLQAGPAHFGMNLKGDLKVTGKSIIIHPLKGCGSLPAGDKMKGKIAIMERGDCMFVEKARRVQKLGAIGAIIIDNTPSSSAHTSPMFSMSGDGTDDVKIPAVFLFTQEASKLLLSISKDSTLDLTLSELKTDAAVWPPSEEESMFQKLKVSVQEFLNKHTGIAFTRSILVGNFKANLESSIDMIKISYLKNEIYRPTKQIVNPKWSQIRTTLLRSIMKSQKKDVLVSFNDIRMYYESYSKIKEETPNNGDIRKPTEWLLRELNMELYWNENQPKIQESHLLEDQEESDGNTSDVAKSLYKQTVLDDVKNESTGTDDLIISEERDSSDKIILSKEQVDASEKNKKDEL
ncbi:PREDICTED: ER degradation-enhancing alpha-mannosidase-like protein 3 [Nicrophorus vespilloides]|uniref:alpha-1,2-Mannosidase n=1 Tax=Nicrophorus vespilloides TaxID=110193 RepID=A0ABM1MTT7_NICVS|nr:PREDICTED: ER degradation-enhancing alpha-mannosidase-like protein 3 [Nicrophorus vespilloides]